MPTAGRFGPPPRVGIVGLGLIGGSVAARLRRDWPATHVIGIDREDVARHAVAVGLVHETRPDCLALAGCGLIILAAPVPAIVAALATGALPSDALVTDVGSTKRRIVAAATAGGVSRFVGGHPLAGSERSGHGHADPDLFEGRPWVLVHPGPDNESLGTVQALVAAMGAVPVRMSAGEHDRVMAFVSHLPHLLSVALMRVAADGCGQTGGGLSGRAFDEMTRLAGSSGSLWQGIIESNRDCVIEALDALHQDLERLGAATREADGLAREFDAANRVREAWRATREHAAGAAGGRDE